MTKTSTEYTNARDARLRRMRVTRRSHYYHIDDRQVVKEFVRGLNTRRFPDFYAYEGERKKDEIV